MNLQRLIHRTDLRPSARDVIVAVLYTASAATIFLSPTVLISAIAIATLAAAALELTSTIRSDATAASESLGVFGLLLAFSASIPLLVSGFEVLLLLVPLAIQLLGRRVLDQPGRTALLPAAAFLPALFAPLSHIDSMILGLVCGTAFWLGGTFARHETSEETDDRLSIERLEFVRACLRAQNILLLESTNENECRIRRSISSGDFRPNRVFTRGQRERELLPDEADAVTTGEYDGADPAQRPGWRADDSSVRMRTFALALSPRTTGSADGPWLVAERPIEAPEYDDVDALVAREALRRGNPSRRDLVSE